MRDLNACLDCVPEGSGEGRDLTISSVVRENDAVAGTRLERPAIDADNADFTNYAP